MGLARPEEAQDVDAGFHHVHPTQEAFDTRDLFVSQRRRGSRVQVGHHEGLRRHPADDRLDRRPDRLQHESE